MILFLDDDQNRAAVAYNRMVPEKRNVTIWCKTSFEAISVLDDDDYVTKLTEVHLDHDLGGKHFQDPTEENCGMEVIRFIEKSEETNPGRYKHISFTIHSFNFDAGKEMCSRLMDLSIEVKYIPFGYTNEVLLYL